MRRQASRPHADMVEVREANLNDPADAAGIIDVLGTYALIE